MLGMLSPQGVYQLFLITCSIHLVHVHENNYQLYYSTNIFLVDLNGCVKAEIFNPAIGEELLREILLWQSEGCSISDIVNCLRKRTVPNEYTYHTWREGILHNNNYCSMSV